MYWLMIHNVFTESAFLRSWLITVTDFGDAAVLIPLAAALFVWLLPNNSRCAVWWAGSVGLCVSLTALSKIYFYGCPAGSEIRSPSGHTGFSVLVYGAMTLVTVIHSRGISRTMWIAVGAALILAIAASRVLLAIHNLYEVGVGSIIGAVALVLFGRNYSLSPRARVWPLLVAVVTLMAILHGQELRAEDLLHRITGYLRVRCG
jgi:membrane-associated phospholipid phosphatase